MFEPTQTKLQAHLAPAIPGIPVAGTFDEIDMASPSAATVQHQIVWMGATVSSSNRRSVKLGHTWAYHVYVATGRADAADLAAASSALSAALRLLLGFQPDRFVFAELRDIPAPEYDGVGVRLSLYFSLSDVAAVAA